MSQRVWTIVAAVGAAFVGGFCGSVLMQPGSAMAQQQDPKAITVSTINIVDAAGKTRMVIGMMDKKVGMMVSTADGKPRVTLGVDGDDAGMVLCYADGKNAMYAGAKGKGSGLTIISPEGKDRVTMGSDPESAGIGLNYTDGSEAWNAGATDKNSGFAVNYPGTGKACFKFGTGPEGTGLTLHSRADKEVFGIGMPPNFGPSMSFHDEKGMELFRAP